MIKLLISVKDCNSDINSVKKTILVNLLDEPQILMNSYYEWNEILAKIRMGEPLMFFRCYYFTSNGNKNSIVELRERIRSIYSNSTPKEIFDSLRDMNRIASIYQAMILRTFRSRRINDHLFNLQMIGVSSSIIFLLKTLSYYREEVLSEEETIFFLKMTEVFLVRSKIIGKRGVYSRQVWDIIVKKMSEVEHSQLLSYVQCKLSEEIEGQLDDHLFKEKFVQRNFRSEEKITKFILWQLSKPSGEMTLNIHTIQTEHIMPKKLNFYWKEYLREHTNFPLERIQNEHKHNCNKIGNMIIIRDKLNRHLAQKLFQKKKILYKKSDLKCARNIVTLPNWGFNEIMERTTDLANQAIKTWKIRTPKRREAKII